jgi:hypothetical protein
MQKFLMGLFFCCCTYFCNAQSIVFRGIPSVKIVEAGLERGAEKIEQSKALSVSCIVREIDGKFLWETRGNKQLLKTDGGAFITFSAVDGSGYIRVLKPMPKETMSLMSTTEQNFDYTEHMLLGLRTITYYGKTM